jgi:hypothetical protein
MVGYSRYSEVPTGRGQAGQQRRVLRAVRDACARTSALVAHGTRWYQASSPATCWLGALAFTASFFAVRSWLAYLIGLLACVEESWVLRPAVQVGTGSPADAALPLDAGVPTPAELPLDAGLLAHFPFDDPPAERNAIDVSPARRNGTLQGGAVHEPDAGRFAGAVRLSDGGVTLRNVSLGRFHAYSLWFRADGPTSTPDPFSGGRIVTSFRGGADRVASSVLVPGDGTDSIWFFYDEVNVTSPSGYARVIIADAGLDPGQWHHVVYSYGDAGLLIAFDGQVQGVPGVGTLPNNGPELGWSPRASRGPAHFSGWIDDVRFWSRALTPAEIQFLWSGQ